MTSEERAVPRTEAGLIPALAYALARADVPDRGETAHEYATRLAPLVIESGYSLAATSESQPQPGLREKLLLELQAAVPGTCDWGGCDNLALLARFDAAKGWLPVCQWHIDAPAAELAPITAIPFAEAWERTAFGATHPTSSPEAE